MDEKEKLKLRKQEDLRFAQGCWIVLVAGLLELFLFQVRDHVFGYTEEWGRLDLINQLLAFAKPVGLLLLVAGILWAVSLCQSGKGDVFYPFAMAFGGMVLFSISYGIEVYGQKGGNILLYLVPAWAGLGLVFCLYQVEFFISAFFTGLGGVGLWLCGQTTLFEGGEMTQMQGTFYVFLNLTLFTIIIGFYLVNKAFQNGGVLQVKNQELTLISDLKDNSSLWLVGLSGVISLLALAIAVTFGYIVIFYCTFALLAWLFVLLVYYTVKMM